MKPQATSHKPQQLCNIDLLRGVAALAVLLWHYQHFWYFTAGESPKNWVPEQQPLFEILKLAYMYGWRAVPFFWILSGFVFFHVYGQQREISFRTFFLNRFSRLYPAHFFTLCLVAILQTVSMMLFGGFQIYSNNDLYHFVLNLFFASNWGLQSGYSFNGPIWSVSVEVLIYGVFFVYLKGIGVNLGSNLIWFCLSFSLLILKPASVFECAALFSLGGVIYQGGRFILEYKGAYFNLFVAVAAMAGVSIFMMYADNPPKVVVNYILFPALINLGSALDYAGISSGYFGRTCGHLTYASYLIHVPLQITIMILLDISGDRSVVATPLFLASFIISVGGLSWLMYRIVEQPVQHWLRKRLN
jgi:peptidoglycan/LPS O-acetylase OafA/YrhL